MVCPSVRSSACTVDNPLAKARVLSLRTDGQTMLYLTCSLMPSVDLARYGYYALKNLVSGNCATTAKNHCTK